MIRDWFIYTIINPKGARYIGRTCNFIKRVQKYKCIDETHKQPLICRSIKKYGFINHQFLVIDEINGTLEDVNNREIFWIDYYKCNNSKYPELGGLNLTDGGGGQLGFKRPLDCLIRQGKKLKGRVFSIESRKKMSEGRINSKIQNIRVGMKHSDISKKRMSEARKGRFGGGLHPAAKLTLNTNTGVFYDCIKEAAYSFNINYKMLHLKLTAKNKKNNTPFILV